MRRIAKITEWLAKLGLRSQIRVGNTYAVPLEKGKTTFVKVLGLGKHRLGFSEAMLVETYGSLATGPGPSHLRERHPLRRYCSCCSFVEEGDWSLIEYDSSTIPQPTEAEFTLWADYSCFLDDVRQRLGLERLKYRGAEFTFSTKCSNCARCRKCRALRQEFAGWENCVTDTVGSCVWSGSATDVKAPDGNYYWAPYFIDLVRDGKFNAG
jgi:hypothetical protein